MPDRYDYPAEIERGEDERFVVAFPDFGWGATDGAGRDEALAETKDLLREVIATTTREGGDLPKPSRAGKGRPRAAPQVQIALKAGSLRRVVRNRDVATPTSPRARRCRERGAAQVESRARHQGRND